ncbi:hypothetical protein FSP39_010578 [Pinctada imbricata]|uniref:Uncharacterized protein n=1 Tax=Pinctada imbricata TaxID=66713 RepID=A0AA88XR40_PINIB|nr:hypothetical protein FSP39_010578 [Pinctada imbricata]
MKTLKKILKSIMETCADDGQIYENISECDGLICTLSLFLEESKRNLNKRLRNMSQVTLRSKACMVLEIDSLHRLIECWINRFKEDSYIFHLPTDYRGVALKYDLVELSRQLIKVYFLLEKIGRKDGDFDRQFVRRLRRKRLLQIEESEIFENEEDEESPRELLTYQRLQVQALHYRAVRDTESDRRTFLQRLSRLNCIGRRADSNDDMYEKTNQSYLRESSDDEDNIISDLESYLENENRKARQSPWTAFRSAVSRLFRS